MLCARKQLRFIYLGGTTSALLSLQRFAKSQIFILDNSFAGNKKVFQIWCWPGDSTKPHIQLQFDHTKPVEDIPCAFFAFELEFGILLVWLCRNLSG